MFYEGFNPPTHLGGKLIPTYSYISPFNVANKTDVSQALVIYGFHTDKAVRDLGVKGFMKIIEDCEDIRRMGSGALDLCYVAAGRCDAYVEPKLQAWDIAAGQLIVSEAGGVTSEWNGQHHPVGTTSMVAANPKLHAEIVGRLKGLI